VNNKINYIIITPVRDEARDIAKTIQSVNCQTLLSSQWIIVNDGSTDDPREVVERYLAIQTSISLVGNPHARWR
jgi:glycosyltransferase involved in cell wall biosynthesis